MNLAVQTAGGTVAGQFVCLTGIIRRAEEIGIIQRGTHRLVDLSGRVIAALRSDQVNLFGLEGQFVTVCGISEGRIEGVLSLRVTQVLPANVPGFTPQPFVDFRLLLLLLFLASLGFPIGLQRGGLFGTPFGFGGFRRS